MPTKTLKISQTLRTLGPAPSGLVYAIPPFGRQTYRAQPQVPMQPQLLRLFSNDDVRVLSVARSKVVRQPRRSDIGTTPDDPELTRTVIDSIGSLPDTRKTGIIDIGKIGEIEVGEELDVVIENLRPEPTIIRPVVSGVYQPRKVDDSDLKFVSSPVVAVDVGLRTDERRERTTQEALLRTLFSGVEIFVRDDEACKPYRFRIHSDSKRDVLVNNIQIGHYSFFYSAAPIAVELFDGDGWWWETRAVHPLQDIMVSFFNDSREERHVDLEIDVETV